LTARAMQWSWDRRDPGRDRFPPRVWVSSDGLIWQGDDGELRFLPFAQVKELRVRGSSRVLVAGDDCWVVMVGSPYRRGRKLIYAIDSGVAPQVRISLDGGPAPAVVRPKAWRLGEPKGGSIWSRLLGNPVNFWLTMWFAACGLSAMLLVVVAVIDPRLVGSVPVRAVNAVIWGFGGFSVPSTLFVGPRARWRKNRVVPGPIEPEARRWAGRKPYDLIISSIVAVLTAAAMWSAGSS
jgi:hypothetical protein